jgi:hypothetical protein
MLPYRPLCPQLIRGIYAVFLEIWQATFGRDALLVLRAEEYYSEPRSALHKVLLHLGLPLEQVTEDQWGRMLEAGTRARNHLMDGKPDMLPEARALVTDFYVGWNKRLAALLRNRDYLWDS